MDSLRQIKEETSAIRKNLKPLIVPPSLINEWIVLNWGHCHIDVIMSHVDVRTPSDRCPLLANEVKEAGLFMYTDVHSVWRVSRMSMPVKLTSITLIREDGPPSTCILYRYKYNLHNHFLVFFKMVRYTIVVSTRACLFLY